MPASGSVAAPDRSRVERCEPEPHPSRSAGKPPALKEPIGEHGEAPSGSPRGSRGGTRRSRVTDLSGSTWPSSTGSEPGRTQCSQGFMLRATDLALRRHRWDELDTNGPSPRGICGISARWSPRSRLTSHPCRTRRRRHCFNRLGAPTNTVRPPRPGTRRRGCRRPCGFGASIELASEAMFPALSATLTPAPSSSAGLRNLLSGY
jgi:hypothetical protein